MDWKERIDSIEFTIITGDGREFKPRMISSVMELVFNTRDFMYLDQQGTYVARKEAQSEVFPLEFWFIGDSHVDDMQQFWKSSLDKRSWVLKSPFFDEINVQVSALKFEPFFNRTIITGQAKRTLPEQLPETKKDLTNDIKQSIISVDNNVIANIEVTNIVSAESSIGTINTNFNKLPNTNNDVVALKDKVRDCTNSLNSVLEKPVQFNESLKALLKFPLDVRNEINTSLNSCLDAINELLNIASTDISLFDLHSTILITSSLELSIDANYNTRNEVNNAQSLLVQMYELQRGTFEQYEYEQDNSNVFELSVILAKTLGRLNEIAFNAKQERRIIADKNASPILYCHKYYGTSDDNLERFIRENNLDLDEYLEISQGRELVYFV
jgi:hypothetical protein